MIITNPKQAPTKQQMIADFIFVKVIYYNGSSTLYFALLIFLLNICVLLSFSDVADNCLHYISLYLYFTLELHVLN